MNSQEKKRTPRGVGWTKLESPGDVRRLLRKLILDTLRGRLDVQKANCVGQLATVLLKSLELSTLADRMTVLEEAVDGHESEPREPHTTH